MLLLKFAIESEYGQTLAFPRGKGFDKYVTGGRDSIVYEVTNLETMALVVYVLPMKQPVPVL